MYNWLVLLYGIPLLTALVGIGIAIYAFRKFKRETLPKEPMTMRKACGLVILLYPILLAHIGVTTLVEKVKTTKKHSVS